jgi:hypothetical protein
MSAITGILILIPVDGGLPELLRLRSDVTGRPPEEVLDAIAQCTAKTKLLMRYACAIGGRPSEN